VPGHDRQSRPRLLSFGQRKGGAHRATGFISLFVRGNFPFSIAYPYCMKKRTFKQGDNKEEAIGQTTPSGNAQSINEIATVLLEVPPAVNFLLNYIVYNFVIQLKPRFLLKTQS